MCRIAGRRIGATSFSEKLSTKSLGRALLGFSLFTYFRSLVSGIGFRLKGGSGVDLFESHFRSLISGGTSGLGLL